MPFLKTYPQLLAVQELTQKQKTEVYLVGGFIRDYLLGRKCLDFDFAVKKDAVGFARKFSRKIHGAFVLLDKEHGCARVVKKNPNRRAETYDFADFRAAGIKGDLSHRDFTVNALACPVSGLSPSGDSPDIIQDFNHGQQDLKAGRIRMVGAKSFKEDPLRLLRAFSLQAQLGFRIEPRTLAQMKKDRDLLRNVSYERIRDELFKVLETGAAAKNIIQMDKLGLLEKIIPQISVMFDVKQGGYHHLNVWGHTLLALAQFEKVVREFEGNQTVMDYLRQPVGGSRSRLALLKLAVILHDIGKPETYKKEDGKISFHGHERVGEWTVRSIAPMLKLSTRERFALQDMVRFHLRPGYLSNFKSPSVRAVFRYFRDAKDEAAGILILSLADQRATKGPMTTKKDLLHHDKICRRLLKEYFEKQTAEPFVRIIDGNDLIRELKLKPSPVFATILREVEELQAAGKVQTKKEALAVAQRIAAKK